MKKYIVAFSMVLCLLLNGNCIPTLANENPSSQGNENPFSQGFYTIRDLNLMENIEYTVRNNSSHFPAMIMVIDSKNYILELVRVEPKSQHCLRTLKFDHTILIYGRGELIFS